MVFNLKTMILFRVMLLVCLILPSCAQDDCKKRISYDSVHLNDDLSLEELYQPFSSTQLDEILRSWDSVSLESEKYEIVEDGFYVRQRRMLTIQHEQNHQRHYGVIIYPDAYDATKSYPTLVWAHGLDQSDPSMRLYSWQGLTSFFNRLNDYVIVVPSFRGQSLVIKKQRFCSDGFFGDAFDGATTDALSLLEVAKNQISNIDLDRIAFAGASRGGTVALLAGIRDTSINAVVSLSGPVDFFSEEVYHRYHRQYVYQFLSQTKDIEAIRDRMIKSSPIYFAEHIRADILVVHGRHDHLVPMHTVQKLIDLLKNKENFEAALVDKVHGFNEMDRVYDWLVESNEKTRYESLLQQ